MRIQELILTESHRYHAFYNHKAEYVFIGYKQALEIDLLIAEMVRFGLCVAKDLPPRATFMGMQVFRVDAESHLSFGVSNPSPCG